MPKYTVLSPLKHGAADGKLDLRQRGGDVRVVGRNRARRLYQPGETIELGEEEARPLLASGTIGPYREPTKEERRARELDLDIGTVAGSGRDGAVTIADIERAAAVRHAAQLGISLDQVGAKNPTIADVDRAMAARREAAALATELGVSVATVTGTGPGGEATIADVRAAAEAQAKARQAGGA